MNKIALFVLIFLSIVIGLSSCSKFRAGDRFTVVVNGVEYQCEVIVSKMNYVRISPVTSSDMLIGEVNIPSDIRYDGTKFVVTQIAKDAFRGYEGITAVVLPSTLSVIEESAFRECASLVSINTPQPLSTIESHAFDGCAKLQSFNLVASLSTLGDACFKSCSSLTNLTFPTSFSKIPNEAFCGCISLTRLNLPATILQVGDKAFENCSGIVSVSFDSSVQTIGSKAFSGCVAVESISTKTPTPPVCSDNTFEGVPSDITVTVPMASVENYRSAVGWNRFSNFVGRY